MRYNYLREHGNFCAAPSADMASTLAPLVALDERNRLLAEENRWLKAQLFGRSSEKTPVEDRNPDQTWLVNEIEAGAQFSQDAPETISIPAHDLAMRGRKKLAAVRPERRGFRALLPWNTRHML